MASFSTLKAFRSGPGLADLKRMASHAEVNMAASVRAKFETIIHAPRQRVWSLLTELDQWHFWHPTVRMIESPTHLQEGVRFTWKSNGVKVKSELAKVQAGNILAWTGEAMGARAIHVWRLRETAEGQTQVETEESMDGFFIGMIYSPDKLKDFLAAWVMNLKKEAEK